jgi:hypothetical protein
MGEEMLKEFIKSCLDIAKEEYFETDHHGHGGEEAKDAEWNNLLKNMDRDFYNEWISPVIEHEDLELWYVADKFMLYMAVKDVIEEM